MGTKTVGKVLVDKAGKTMTEEEWKHCHALAEAEMNHECDSLGYDPYGSDWGFVKKQIAWDFSEIPRT